MFLLSFCLDPERNDDVAVSLVCELASKAKDAAIASET